mmetsp:Transcript_137274/g.256331  ORF Transcript_137274/g.256331 Transcript_137274/m.256331 type:complete len:202 (-) Transcript_137274:293-898(-)
MRESSQQLRHRSVQPQFDKANIIAREDYNLVLNLILHNIDTQAGNFSITGMVEAILPSSFVCTCILINHHIRIVLLTWNDRLCQSCFINPQFEVPTRLPEDVPKSGTPFSCSCKETETIIFVFCQSVTPGWCQRQTQNLRRISTIMTSMRTCPIWRPPLRNTHGIQSVHKLGFCFTAWKMPDLASRSCSSDHKCILIQFLT